MVFDEQWCQILGYEYAEIEANPNSWRSRIHKDDLDSRYLAIQAHIDGKTDFYNHIHRMRHKDGKWRYILDRGKVVQRDSNNNPIRFTGTNIDVTYLKDIEHKLLLQTNEYEKLVNNIPSMIYKCKLKKNWTMFFLNDAIYDLTGYKADELLNNKTCSYTSLIHPDDIQMINESIMQAIKKNKPFEFDYRLIHKNGHIIWVHEHGQRFIDENQQFYLEGIVEDITQRTKSEEKLKLAASVFANAREGILITDASGIIIEINETFSLITGYSREEIIGHNPSILQSGLQSGLQSPQPRITR